MNYASAEKYFLYLLIISFFGLVIFFSFLPSHNHFTELAYSFSEGHLYFSDEFISGQNTLDMVYMHDKYYWPLSPLPAMLFLPLVIFLEKSVVLFFSFENIFTLISAFLVFYLCYRIALCNFYSRIDSLWLAFAFTFASVYQFNAFVSSSWFFVQSLTVFLMLLGIYEWFGRKRYWLIGVIFSLVFSLRFTAGLGVLFFVAHIVSEKSFTSGNKLRQLVLIALPIIAMGTFLLWYNYARFDNIFENGYMLANNNTLTETERFELLNYGLFQLRNIPTNIYYYFVNSLEPIYLKAESWNGNTYVLQWPYVRVGPLGVAFYVVAPIFLYIFRARFNEKIVKFSLIPICVILFMLLTYFYPGGVQIGPRYLLDIMPFAFLLLLYSFKDFCLTLASKALISVSALINLYLFILTVFFFPWLQ